MVNLFPVGIGNSASGESIKVPIDEQIEATIAVESVTIEIAQDEITYEITDNPE